MIATFDGQDYDIMLQEGELQRLRKERLETPLRQHWGGANLGKTVSLEFAENDGMDGIKLTYSPIGLGWEKIQRIQVKINERAYRYVEERGRFGTRYNGSDKIEIIDESRSGFSFLLK